MCVSCHNPTVTAVLWCTDPLITKMNEHLTVQQSEKQRCWSTEVSTKVMWPVELEQFRPERLTSTLVEGSPQINVQLQLSVITCDGTFLS